MQEHSDFVKIRKMTVADLPFCRHLVNQAGWNQSDADWLRTMELEPEGCLIAEKEGISVATTTTCCFGTCAWIAMVLVDTAFRNQGIAKQMLLHAIRYLENKGMTTIRLDATALGEGLYRKLGFEGEYEVTRFMREPLPGHPAPVRAEQIVVEEVMRDINTLDMLATGADRTMLLRSLMGQRVPFCYTQDDDHQPVSYACTRAGISAVQIGPAVAVTLDAGRQVLDEIIGQLRGETVFIDIPTQNSSAVQWAEVNGFAMQRTFLRMYRGKRIQDFPQFIWASSGPEKG
jgi:ribosomal protein S18 acetylase RimI-like enzyme